MSASPPSDSREQAQTRKRQNSTSDGNDRPPQKQRANRTTFACERCRAKKLRCIGGHPCSACQRAKADCDYGDRGWDAQQSMSVTNQRLSQLEKTMADLVAGLSHLTHPRPSSAGALMQDSTQALSPHNARNEANSPPMGTSFSPGHAVSTNAQAGGAQSTSHLRSPPGPHAQTVEQSNVSTITQSTISPMVSAQGLGPATTSTRGPPANARASEKLESRWAALQQDSAPFPPLMAHPAVWSVEPAGTSPDDTTTHLSIGMTHFNAQLHLKSEPIYEGLVGEVAARALFMLFFRKCHPSFPILEVQADLDSHFDHIRSSSPFLFTSILAVAARYYTSYRKTQPATLTLPPISANAIESLADMACAHLGFVGLRKQHQLSDVQAALLLSVWIPRGKGLSPDQWMTTGLCIRLAYRIGIPDSISNSSVSCLLNSNKIDVNDVRDINKLLPQWHTWLILTQYDKSLSLGFGRPSMISSSHVSPQQYLKAVRKVGTAASIDQAAASYVTSLVELSAITTELISVLRDTHLQFTTLQDSSPSTTTATSKWTKIINLLSNLNPSLDDWQRRWTWGGSYDAIALGGYTRLVMIYGEHARLCLNSLSLNLLMSNAVDGQQQNQVPLPYLAKGCEAAMAIVQNCVEPNASGAESVIRYGADYLVLILGQATLFFIRVLATRPGQDLPIDQLVLLHYLKKAIELMEANDASTTGICGSLARVSRDLARYAGLSLDNDGNLANNDNSAIPDTNLSEAGWDFDVSAFLDQNTPAGQIGLDLGGYFDLTQSFFPPSESNAPFNTFPSTD